jgi:hypothetical protein
MRLQLDTVPTATGTTRSGESGPTVPVGGTGADSTRIRGDSSAGDSIQISGPSSALNRLAVDRAARIHQLSALVQSGSYQVSGAQVGRAIVEHALGGAR